MSISLFRQNTNHDRVLLESLLLESQGCWAGFLGRGILYLHNSLVKVNILKKILQRTLLIPRARTLTRAGHVIPGAPSNLSPLNESWPARVKSPHGSCVPWAGFFFFFLQKLGRSSLIPIHCRTSDVTTPKLVCRPRPGIFYFWIIIFFLESWSKGNITVHATACVFCHE